MEKPKVYAMPFSKIYPMYVEKAQRKGRTKDEVDEIILWLTGYDQSTLEQQIAAEADMETFFAQSPQINLNARLIKGSICGCRVEEMEAGTMQQIRWLDKLIDELAKGKPMEKILRK